jgi:hypothetical protein
MSLTLQDRLVDTARAVVNLSLLGERWPHLLGRDRLTVLFATLLAVATLLANAHLLANAPEGFYLMQNPTLAHRLVLQGVDMAAGLLFVLGCGVFTDRERMLTLLLGLIYVGVPVGALTGALITVQHTMAPGFLNTALQTLLALGSFVLIAGMFRTALRLRPLATVGLTFLLLALVVIADISVQMMWLGSPR